MTSTLPAANPLLADWNTPHQLPPFSEIHAGQFAAAFDAAMALHRAELDALAASAVVPDFANTVAAFDAAGVLFKRIERVFGNLTASATSPELQAVERDMAPRLAAHEAALYLNEAMFARIDAVHQQRAVLGLSPEQWRLTERIHLDFVRAGARLAPAARQRLAAIGERLAQLQTAFSQNVLGDESSWKLVLRDPAELAGLPSSLLGAARAAAVARGEPGAWVITLSRSLVVPFLTYSERRDLREVAFTAWTRRGELDGERDNPPLMREILQLRAELARLHGYANFADYALIDRMAGTPAAVAGLLEQVWPAARAKALAERDVLQAEANARGDSITIEPWDWRYYAEKVRQSRYALDDAELKPYFPLEAMVAAAFDCAQRLFGLTFTARADWPVYHPDVRAYEVRNAAGDPVAVFLHDNFARATKRGGAWMSVFRGQSRALGEVIPVVVNNNNFAKGEPTLLSVDEVRTLFHEFGHGLHGMLSNVTYERLGGTQVLRDFVELPSQIFEHWAMEPEVLKRFARHVETGEPIPDALIDKLARARRFNQGFETVEYTACALIDMALHAADASAIDLAAFEREQLERLGMPREIVLRHRLPHFQHLFSSDAYAAGYYVYLWAEVLDADGYEAFVEAGSPFDPATAQRLHRSIYAVGNTVDPAAAYRAFRGRDAAVEPLLAKRGLIKA
ncbi:MAG: M3 family metallopeptidase [Burkholderiaceae bacterium]